MPYIPPEQRSTFDAIADQLACQNNDLQLRQILYLFCQSTSILWGSSYEAMSHVMGCLDCAKRELIRRSTVLDPDEISDVVWVPEPKKVNYRWPGRTYITPGQLTYVICMIIIKSGFLRYSAGILEGVQRDFYERIMAPYEDTKIKQNGDLEWPNN